MCRLLIVLATLAFSVAALASPGVLDPSFGKYGVAQAPAGAAPIVQRDGRVLTGGSIGDRAVVTRLDSRGQPDATFGVGGTAYVELATGFATTRAMALQPDGKILAAGETYTEHRLHGMIFVARFNSDGSVDRTFGDGGSVTGSVVPQTPSEGNVFYPDYVISVAIALAPDGAIYLAAQALRVLGNESRAMLVRLDGRGTRDTSFADPLWQWSSTVQLQFVVGPVVQTDGKVVVALWYYPISGGTGLPVTSALRVATDGSPDVSYGQAGEANVPLQPSQILLEASGDLLIAGVQSGLPVLRVARLTATGSSDPAFGSNGIAAASFGPCGRIVSARIDPCPYGATAIALQPDGKIVQVGVSVDPIGATAITRFGADGRIDPGFGIDGRVYARGLSPGAAVVDGAYLYVAPGYCCGGAIARFLLASVPVALEASANPANADAPVTLNANVTGAALGVVSFYDDNGVIANCANVPLTSGGASARATCTTAFANGTHSVAAAHFDVAGTTRGASDPLIVSAGDWNAAAVTEFHYAPAGDYFMTSDPVETATLDATPGWQRTGETFRAFPSSTPATRWMCRYYTAASASPRTHFFGATAAECGLGYPWLYEVDTIAVMTPAPNGSCANGTLPLYRMFDPNGSAHRYATSAAVRDSMLAQGWIAEGFGVGVVACMAR